MAKVSRHRKKLPAKPKTRKEIRKEKHLQKKENKRKYFSTSLKKREAEKLVLEGGKKPKSTKTTTDKSSTFPGPEEIAKYLRDDIDHGDEEIESDFSDVELPEAIVEYNRKAKLAAAEDKLKSQTQSKEMEQHLRDKQKQKKLDAESRKNRNKQLRRANVEEDAMIAKLEKKLKINKSKNKKRLVSKMFNDGLDYALEFCLDDDDDSTDKKKKAKKESTNNWDESDMEEEFGESFGDEDDEKVINTAGGADSGSDDDFGDRNSDDSEGDDDESGETEPNVKEDIYGRKRDIDGNIITDAPQKYVPPHQRAALEVNQVNRKEELDRLRKNCKGFLNRLSEANMHKMATSIEALYRKNSRFDMNNTLGNIISEALISKTISNERMVQEHIVLLAYLHAQVGSEIGAHFLQLFINEFSRLIRDIETLEIEDKQLNNVVLILSYFYIFKIFQHTLILEIIEKFCEKLCEKSVECLLLIFQSIGFRIRKDDPMAFKSLILSIQKKISESSMELKENPRLKFMVDILNAVKNNNLSKIPQFDPELAENLRKKLKAMLTNEKYVITLNITMDDLLKADEVGKWWIVGSAWTGNIKDINAANKTKPGQQEQKSKFSEKLLALAKEQKMNTDERRNIFCIIMSAEDYVDAFEKILHLGLKDQRTIASIIIHCCLTEKNYNPYYAFIAHKFCTYDRKYQLALQFALWDRINEIQSMDKMKVKKMARFILHLILQDGLSIAVLKIVNFAGLDKLSSGLMKEIMLGVLLAKEDECRQVFEKIVRNTKLGVFKNSIRLFIQHFLLKNESSLKLDEEKLELLKNRVEFVDRVLAFVDF